MYEVEEPEHCEVCGHFHREPVCSPEAPLFAPGESCGSYLCCQPGGFGEGHRPGRSYLRYQP